MELKSLKYDFWKLAIVSLSILQVSETTEVIRTFPMLMPNVHPLKKEAYVCTSFKMPETDYEYIVGFTPNASMHTVHHMQLRGCNFPGAEQMGSPSFVWDCDEMSQDRTEYQKGPTCSSEPQPIYAWARDAPALTLPAGVAFKVGKGTGINYIVLQVHYSNVSNFENGGTDNSGVIVSLLPSSTKKITRNAGILVIRAGGMIAAGKLEHMEASCEIEEPLVLHPFAFRTHTHALGKVACGYQIDKNGEWHLIGKHDPQEPQMFYPSEKNLTIGLGDIVATRCTLFNHKDRDVYRGPTSEHEMCTYYVMYYVDGDKTLTQKYCFSKGPPTYYWHQDPKIGYVPPSIDKSASQLN